MRPALAALFVASLLSSCVIDLGNCSFAKRVRGSGLRVTEERPLEDFDRITISGPFRVMVRAGQDPRLVVRGDDNLLEHVEARVREGHLQVGTPRVSISSQRPLELEIGVRRLHAFQVTGSAHFELEGVDSERLTVAVSGSANGRATGRVEALTIQVSGSARLEFFELAAREVDLAVSGSGRVDLHAEERLDSSISGSAAVRYRGTPAVMTRSSGSASVQSARD